jgi:hypothetical protein
MSGVTHSVGSVKSCTAVVGAGDVALLRVQPDAALREPAPDQALVLSAGQVLVREQDCVAPVDEAGEHGWSFIPSDTRRSARLLPPVPHDA